MCSLKSILMFRYFRPSFISLGRNLISSWLWNRRKSGPRAMEPVAGNFLLKAHQFFKKFSAEKIRANSLESRKKIKKRTTRATVARLQVPDKKIIDSCIICVHFIIQRATLASAQRRWNAVHLDNVWLMVFQSMPRVLEQVMWSFTCSSARHNKSQIDGIFDDILLRVKQYRHSNHIG